jgi:tetratricopeptide (TPR) repeat protein
VLKIYRELAQKDAEAYLSHVAITLNNLGILDQDQNQVNDARKEYEEALKIYRGLAEKEPETYLPYVAATLINLGVLDRAQNEPEKVRKTFEEALNIQRADGQHLVRCLVRKGNARLNQRDGGKLWRDHSRDDLRRADVMEQHVLKCPP